MSNYYTNKETLEKVIELGIKKTNTTFIKTLLLGFLGGMFISLGFLGDLIATTGTPMLPAGLIKVIGASIFPVGLILVVIVGGDLFTGNVLSTLAYLNKKATLNSLLKNFLAVWIGNFVGALVFAYLIYLMNLANTDIKTVVIGAANYKLHYNNLETIISGFFCNTLVALAIWASLASKDVIGKIFAIWFPIFLFIIIGFHHCVANMFLFGYAFFLDGSMDINHMFISIIMATIGNFLSGGLFFPIIYKYIYA